MSCRATVPVTQMLCALAPCCQIACYLQQRVTQATDARQTDMVAYRYVQLRRAHTVEFDYLWKGALLSGYFLAIHYLTRTFPLVPALVAPVLIAQLRSLSLFIVAEARAEQYLLSVRRGEALVKTLNTFTLVDCEKLATVLTRHHISTRCLRTVKDDVSSTVP